MYEYVYVYEYMFVYEYACICIYEYMYVYVYEYMFVYVYPAKAFSPHRDCSALSAVTFSNIKKLQHSQQSSTVSGSV